MPLPGFASLNPGYDAKANPPMVIKLKHVWYFVLTVLGVLAFFNVFSWPKDSQAAMKLLNAIDVVIFRPAAHPTMFALVVGLAIGTVFIPEIWRVVRDHNFPEEPKPNMDLQEAIDYLRIRSRWGLGRVHYSHNESRLLEQDIDEVIRDVATQGRIRIWGRPGHDTVLGQPTEIEIPRAEWPNMTLDLTTMEGGAPDGVCARAHAQDQYCWLRREIYREWSPASCARLFFDKTWKSRRNRIADEPTIGPN